MPNSSLRIFISVINSVATQYSVIRGDYFGTETINLSSSTDDFSNMACTGQLRAHPDGDLLHQFVPTIAYAESGSGSVTFDIVGSVTKNLPPINLYGDIQFYSTGIRNQTFFEFRLNVTPDVTHL